MACSAENNLLSDVYNSRSDKCITSLNVSKLYNICNRVSDIKTDLCNKLSIRDSNNFSKITAQSISDCGQLRKKDLGKHILGLITLLEPLTDYSLDLADINEENIKSIERLISGRMSKEFTEFDKSQTFELTSIKDEIQKLSDIVKTSMDEKYKFEQLLSTTNFSNHPPDSKNDGLTHTTLLDHDHTSCNTDHINNPTKCVDKYMCDFISDGESQNLIEFLNNCSEFSENPENGHSVALFGYPYHYTGSMHSDIGTDIPDPIVQLIQKIENEYPGTELNLNSCLINKYCGPESNLPRHSDNESTIEPGSSIFTISLGTKVDVMFTEIYNPDTVVKQTVAPNSLYAMSHKSQTYWEHEIKKCNSFASSDIRYSLTFRHVSKKYSKSSIIIGDSNTYNLKFGEGVGTFGHNIPGKRVEAYTIGDINPTDCCGYHWVIAPPIFCPYPLQYIKVITPPKSKFPARIFR